GHTNYTTAGFSNNDVTIDSDYVYDFKLTGPSGFISGNDVINGIGICISLDLNCFYGYVYDTSTDSFYIRIYGDEPITFDSLGFDRIDYVKFGGHWDGTEIHSKVCPDYSQVMIEGRIKPYPQDSNGSVKGLADHLLYMAVDTNGQYCPFDAVIDNVNMLTSNLFHTDTGNSGFGQPCFRGLVFKATTSQQWWYPFQLRDSQDIQFVECEFDLGENQKAAIAIDYKSNDDEWEGYLSFCRCVLNGGNGLVRWDGSGSSVLLPKGEISVIDCIIENTSSHALSWVTECHNNLIYNCRGYGIITARQCHANIRITNNTIIACDQGIFSFPVDSVETGNVGPIIIARNIIKDVLGRGIGIGRGYGPVILEDNIVWNY
ncbi:MAG: hypothetical protein MI892_26840, partial [Desulfobacterales bacterium]|nr:hypothetical protein [Desulfobacterales bacterium]